MHSAGLAKLTIFLRCPSWASTHHLSMRLQIFRRAFAGTHLGTVPSRSLSCSAAAQSGHNRWSKIKHHKGKEDALKSKARTLLSHEIMLASKCGFRDLACTHS